METQNYPNVTVTDDDLKCFSERTVAELLGFSVSGVRKLRSAGLGPKWVRIGKRHIRYTASAVRQFLLERERGE